MKRRVKDKIETICCNGNARFCGIEVKDNFFIDPEASLTILTFKAGSLLADFPDCVKAPGIYGSLMTPIELLDSLRIENGVNTGDVRFAAQFRLSQSSLDILVSFGTTFTLTSNLSIILHD